MTWQIFLDEWLTFAEKTVWFYVIFNGVQTQQEEKTYMIVVSQGSSQCQHVCWKMSEMDFHVSVQRNALHKKNTLHPYLKFNRAQPGFSSWKVRCVCASSIWGPPPFEMYPFVVPPGAINYPLMASPLPLPASPPIPYLPLSHHLYTPDSPQIWILLSSFVLVW
jgi:hypothetical protein